MQTWKRLQKVAVASRMQNAGQSCIAAKRFMIVEEIFDSFVDAIKLQFEKLKQGDPRDSSVTSAPMARLDLAEKLKDQMQRSVAKGAVITLGGEVNGCNYQPTLLMKVHQGHGCL
jgi:succinate-semialdehyde dehydrogenase/glutarate-semialdehyde dehydrogenase